MTKWIITGQLKLFLDELAADGRDEVLVVEDGAPAHRAAVSKAVRLDASIRTLDHPPSSSDWNPIETVCLRLKTNIGSIKRDFTTLDQL